MKKLQEAFVVIDPEKKGKLSYDLFKQAMLDAEMAVMPREFDELMKELDTTDSGCAEYQVFLDKVFI